MKPDGQIYQEMVDALHDVAKTGDYTRGLRQIHAAMDRVEYLRGRIGRVEKVQGEKDGLWHLLAISKVYPVDGALHVQVKLPDKC